VPVGGAAIVKSGSTAYVVAQPTAGQFVAHSAVCPHAGCLCNQISGAEAVCPCHGSRFNATTGAVVRGPAKTGLAPANVTADGGTLQLS
jgi:nitrite reductase/ring-hydroxylating ferredoxin subunit